MLSRDCDREAQHTPTAATGSCLLAHHLPASPQPAQPAKDKADDRGEGKNQICKSTKHINLFGPSERGKNSSAGASHLASFARSLLL